MAHLLRGKQTGIGKDLSAGIFAELLAPDEIARYGINSQIHVLAYDPVQSLLAVGTGESKYGSGQIYVFGQKRVSVTLKLPRKASVTGLRFVADKLVSVDSKNELSIYSLESKSLLTSYAAPGSIRALTTDPILDWAFLGLQTGEVVIYDLDRRVPASLRLPNFWRDRSPKSRLQPVVALAPHPRDVGKLLVGYSDGAVVYSFKQNKTTNSFLYELPPGAPGGSPNPETINTVRRPKLTQAIWHPTGTFVLTGHEDSSIVIWDLKEDRVVMARTLQDTNINKRSGRIAASGSGYSRPLVGIAWCSKQNPEDTGLLIAGGASAGFPANGLTFLELGITPGYATSSWEVFAGHFANPKRQHILPTPPEADVTGFCLIPNSSPHHAGSHDPLAVMTTFSNGEVTTLSFPTGHPIPTSNLLHVSLSFVQPFVDKIDFAEMEPARWLSMSEARRQGPRFLHGGAEATRARKRHESRTVVQTCHGDGTIRMWDMGHGDDIGNEDVVQVDVALALQRYQKIDINVMSMAGATGELAVGTAAGEVVVFRWGKPDGSQQGLPAMANGLSSIAECADPSVKEGLLPLTLYKAQAGPVTALKMSDLGFLAAGYEGGKLAIIDMRGPAVIYDAAIDTLVAQSKRRSLLRSSTSTQAKREWPTTIEFGILTLEGDEYSSIACFVGTNLGHVATFKLLPEPNGTYRVQHAGSTSVDERTLLVAPIDIETGVGAYANQRAASDLRAGRQVHGALVVVTPSGARIFKPASAKGAHKNWDDTLCYSASIVDFEGRAYALVGVFGDGSIRAYSLPALKEIGAAKLPKNVDLSRLTDVLVTGSGFVIAWTGPSEVGVFNVWGNGKELPSSEDRLYNAEAVVPPRPTISNLQWIAGSQHVTPADMDILIGGPDRPMSRQMMQQAHAEEQRRRQAGQAGPSSAAGRSGPGPEGEEEGYWAYMQRQVNERTEKLGIVGDSMDQLQEQSSGWAKDVNSYVSQQKRKMVFGSITSKFGL